jgi:hypothetical protein
VTGGQARLAPLRFYRWCGIVLMLAGAAGILWQATWREAS